MSRTEFRDRIVVAALGVDVREPGAFSALVSGGIAVLVVRGDDGMLRAFTNTCRHRDPVVVAERETPGMHATAAFACPFADWPVAHGGSGRRVEPLAVAEAHGVVLVRPGDGTPFDPDVVIDVPAARFLDGLGLDRYECAAAAHDVDTRSWREVVDELAAPPGTGVIADHAVIATSAAPDQLELYRAFGTDDGTTIVDRRRYELRA